MQNRLNEIRELSNVEKWNYVKINSNPADSFWWEGPQFLKEKHVQNILNTDILFKDESNELKTTAVKKLQVMLIVFPMSYVKLKIC